MLTAAECMGLLAEAGTFVKPINIKHKYVNFVIEINVFYKIDHQNDIECIKVMSNHILLLSNIAYLRDFHNTMIVTNVFSITVNTFHVRVPAEAPDNVRLYLFFKL